MPFGLNKKYNIKIIIFFVTLMSLHFQAHSWDSEAGPVIASVNINSCVGSITISVTSGLAPYTYVWENSGGTILPSTTFVADNLTADNYTVTVTDVNGDFVKATYTVTNPPDLVGTVVVNDVTCRGDSDAQVVVTMGNGNPGYDWVLENSGGAQVATGGIAFPNNIITIGGLGVDSYTLQVTDQDGCTGEINFVVTQPANFLGVSLIDQDHATCSNLANGRLEVVGTGGWGGYTYQWYEAGTANFLGNNAVLSGLLPGDYQVFVTDANGCVVNDTYTINSPDPIVATAVIGDASCNGNSDGNIDVTVTGGNGGYTYSWSNGETTEDISGLAAGTYTLTITDALGCVLVEPFTVAEPAVLTINESITDVDCHGDNTGRINSNVSGGTAPYSYLWSTGHTGRNLRNRVAGTYSLTVTDANGCITNEVFTITEPAAALSVQSVLSNEPSCFGSADGSLSVIMTGGTAPYSYSWSNGSTSNSTGAITSGSYTVTVTDANGCILVENYLLNDPIKIAVSPTLSPPTCNGGSDGSITVVATNGNAPYTYNWNTGDVGGTVNGLVAGNYQVTVTDASGCSVVEDITLGEPVAITGNALVNDISCNGLTDGSIFLTTSGGTAPYTYSWSTGATTANISGLSAGAYTVTITDFNGCSEIEVHTVVEPAPIQVTYTQIDVLCTGNSTGSIDLTPSGGTAPYTFLWSTGATTEDVHTLTAGNYSVTVKDASNCSVGLNITITEPAAALSTTGTMSHVTCNGSTNGSIDLSVLGGVGPYTYSWNTGATSQDLINIAAGNYSVQVTDANGCIAVEAFTITEPTPIAVASVVNQVSCNGADDAEIAITTSGGVAPYSFSWSDGPTSEDRSGLSPGNYALTITDANGCIKVENFVITEPDPLGLSNVAQSVNCYGESTGEINLTVTGGTAPYTFNWSNGSLTEDLTNISAGTYSVVVTDANGCTIGDTITITEPSSALSMTSNVQQIVCSGNADGFINLTVSGGSAPYTYNWSHGSTSEDLSNLSAGTYTVTVTDNLGCQLIEAFTITDPPILSAAGIAQDVTCFGDNDGTIDLTVSGGEAPYTFVWSHGAVTEDISGLGPGAYSVQITDARGCSINEAFNITEPALLSMSYSKTDVLCFGGANGSIEVTTTGGTAPYFYTWSNGAANEDIADLVAGDYTLIITDANGCSINETITIAEPIAALSVSGHITNESCAGFNNGIVDITVSGGTAPYTYSWNTGDTSQDIGGLAPGVYEVSITDANGCMIIESYTVSGPQPLTLSGVGTNLTCYQSTDGVIDITVAGGTAPYSFSWTNGASTEDLSGLAIGTYSVTVTDANGCIVNDTYTLTEPLPLVANYVVSDVTCFGEVDGSIDVAVTGGTAPYAYSWSNGSVSEDLTDLDGGTYDLTVTDSQGCQTIVSVPVSAPSAPLSATATIFDSSCNGQPSGQITLNVTGGTGPFNFLWSNGSNQQNLVNVFAGTYSVQITDSQGCSFQDTYSIGQPDAIEADFDVLNSTCFGDTDGRVIVTASGGSAPYTYVWSNGSTSKDQYNLTGGTYNVTITDANNCSVTEQVVVGDSRSLSVDVIKTDVLCKGESSAAIQLDVTGGSGSYTYLWSTGEVTQSIDALSAGVYDVTISDSGGCATTTSVVISEPALSLSVNLTNTIDVACFGDNSGNAIVNPSGGVGPYTYLWSTGERTAAIANLEAGNYSVAVTDANGCVAQEEFTISQPTSPIEIMVFGNTELRCNGQSDGSIQLSVSGGSGPYTYLWNTGSTATHISNLVAGDYTVRVTDANGCVQEKIIAIEEPQELRIANVNINQSKCFDDRNGAIELDIEGGTLPYTYQWSTGAITKNIVGIPAGVYALTVTDARGCQVQTQYVLEDPALFQTNPEVLPITCVGANDGVITLNIEGGVEPMSIRWNTGASTETLTGLAPGIYNVIITDGNDCSIQQNFNVIEPLPLTLDAYVEDAVRCGDPRSGRINMIVSGGTEPYSYRWSNGETSSALNDVLPGTYVVTVTDANGCQATGTYSVQQPEPLQIGLSTLVVVDCETREVSSRVTADVVGGTGNYTYKWNVGNSVTSEIVLTEPTRLTLVVADQLGCERMQSIDVRIPELAEADYYYQSESIDRTGELAANEPVSFFDETIGEAVDWTWKFGDGFDSKEVDPIHTFDAPGTYEVILSVLDASGCTSERIQTLEITEGYRIMSPTAFTPNGDGNNDFFRPKMLGLETVQFSVFNTWGEIIFSTDDIDSKGWNGMINGKPAENGNYIYKIFGISFNGLKVEREGVFALIR